MGHRLKVEKMVMVETNGSHNDDDDYYGDEKLMILTFLIPTEHV